MDLVIDLDPIPIDFWHRRIPKRIPRGLILARSNRRWELASKAPIVAWDLPWRRARIRCCPPEFPPPDYCIRHSFNFYDEQYAGIHDAP